MKKWPACACSQCCQSSEAADHVDAGDVHHRRNSHHQQGAEPTPTRRLNSQGNRRQRTDSWVPPSARLPEFPQTVARGSPSKTPREPARIVLWRWTIAIAALPASVRRNSSSVLRLLISLLQRLFSWSTACTASSLAATFGPSSRSARCVAAARPSPARSTAPPPTPGACPARPGRVRRAGPRSRRG